MKTKITRFAVLSTVALGTILAQGGGSPPDPAKMVQMRVDRLTRLLSLTDAQASQATTIFTNAQTASTTLHTSLATARTALSAAVKANDTNTITTQATAIGTLQGQLLAIQSKAEAAFYAILTADQQAKYAEFGGGHFGPGMGRYGRPGGRMMGPMGGPPPQE